MGVNATFDPYTQPFDIYLADGFTQIEASVAHINNLLRLSVYSAIAQGAQIGAATILFTAIFLMTKSAKRRSWIFVLNALALMLVIARSTFVCASITGPFYEFYRWETHDYINLGSAQPISVCGEVFSFLLTLAIESSLFMQVRIVCCNLDTCKRYAINISNGLIIFVAVCVRFALMVVNIHWGILNIGSENDWQYIAISKLASAANICLCISIGFSTIIFVGKLALAIQARRSMGMKQFGPMQIIFVMGLQTMFTPFIFTIITYSGIRYSNVQSFVPTVVAVSLPLSGMWAAVNTNNVHVANPNSDKHRVVPVGASDNIYSGSGMSKDISTNDASTVIDDDHDDCKGLTSSPTKSGTTTSAYDLEMQKLNAVQVQRSYSVRSD